MIDDKCELQEEQAIERLLLKASKWGFVVLGVMALVSLVFYPEGDSKGFWRTLWETWGPCLCKAVLVPILLYYLEYGLKGCWLKRIYETNYGATILFAVILLCILR